MINIIAQHLHIYIFTVLFHTVEDYTKPQASCCDTDKLLDGLTSVGWAFHVTCHQINSHHCCCPRFQLTIAVLILMT